MKTEKLFAEVFRWTFIVLVVIGIPSAGFWMDRIPTAAFFGFGIFMTAVVVPIIHVFRCANCGVSWFFNPNAPLAAFAGIDLFAKIPSRCRKCGSNLKIRARF
ncbi:hypothetical protein GRI43_01280 [Altererythrobacter luteolus]|uniref:Uncharacterized protein n=1 Tax=Pontixanthobacter luteolus TaxID=295089 RepID=A0A6I4V0V0_9SPHN|nr:hypothetical protein [Pontixanthobacter luteolus]MXP46024.1 hypothetical protein [Pontixanthobacter luteolus]